MHPFLEGVRRTAAIYWRDGAHVMLPLHPHYVRFQVGRHLDLPDATPANSDYQAVQIGPRKLQASLMCYASAPNSLAIESALTLGTLGSLIYGRLGEAPGFPKRGFPAVVSLFEETLNHTGVPLFNITFSATGAPLFDIQHTW
jgi:hypothetical protein